MPNDLSICLCLSPICNFRLSLGRHNIYSCYRTLLKTSQSVGQIGLTPTLLNTRLTAWPTTTPQIIKHSFCRQRRNGNKQRTSRRGTNSTNIVYAVIAVSVSVYFSFSLTPGVSRSRKWTIYSSNLSTSGKWLVTLILCEIVGYWSWKLEKKRRQCIILNEQRGPQSPDKFGSRIGSSGLFSNMAFLYFAKALWCWTSLFSIRPLEAIINSTMKCIHIQGYTVCSPITFLRHAM